MTASSEIASRRRPSLRRPATMSPEPGTTAPIMVQLTTEPKPSPSPVECRAWWRRPRVRRALASGTGKPGGRSGWCSARRGNRASHGSSIPPPPGNGPPRVGRRAFSHLGPSASRHTRRRSRTGPAPGGVLGSHHHDARGARGVARRDPPHSPLPTPRNGWAPGSDEAEQAPVASEPRADGAAALRRPAGPLSVALLTAGRSRARSRPALGVGPDQVLLEVDLDGEQVGDVDRRRPAAPSLGDGQLDAALEVVLVVALVEVRGSARPCPWPATKLMPTASPRPSDDRLGQLVDVARRRRSCT